VTEISEYLGVSPKAVIDHLRKLEEAGLVESQTDDQRRKYFHIARNLRLEVDVSPYEFGMKSAYPASASLDVSRCRYLSVDVSGDSDGCDVPDDEVANAADGGEEVAQLARELNRLEELKSELSLAQRWVRGRLTEVQESLSDVADENGEGRAHAEMLAALADGAKSVPQLSDATDVPYPVVEEILADLADQGYVEHEGGHWRIAD
jgi:ArsR family transcriptional regulator